MPLLVDAGRSQIFTHRGSTSVGWWDGGNGSIPAANVVEHVENPTQGQLYAGGTLSTAWSVSFRLSIEGLFVNQTVFGADTGLFIIGRQADGNCVYTPSGWGGNGLIATGDHTYMVVSSGTVITIYRDNAQIGSTVTNGVDIGGNTRWRTRGDNSFPLTAAIPRAGHVANIALDSTQRAALHTSMMAL